MMNMINNTVIGHLTVLYYTENHLFPFQFMNLQISIFPIDIIM